MPVWIMPEKVLLPAWMFEGRIGRLSNGDQVLGYVAPHGRPCMAPRCLQGGDPWAGQPSRWTAVVHLFDADGHHRASHAQTGKDPPASPDGSQSPAEREQARLAQAAALRDLLEPIKAGGWEDADIRVRPFAVTIDGLTHGLVCQAGGDDPTWDEEHDPQTVRFLPFGYVFHRPWNEGSFDS